MAIQTVTVNLPDRLYLQLKDRALQSNRTVEAELVEVLAAAIPLELKLSAEIMTELASLDRLDTTSLRRAAQKRLAPRAAQSLERLHLKRQQEGLSDAEERKRAELLRQYEETMLVRARAAVLLKQRGHNVSDLVHPE